MDTPKTITINDVARQSGVSIATVSRVLNDPSRVKKETYDKVMTVIHDLQYECSSLNLKIDKSGSKLVAIFLPTIQSETLSEIAKGALEGLEKNNIDSFIWNANENTNTEMRGLSVLLERQTQGAIFITSCVEDVPLVDIYSQIPVVAIERAVPDKEHLDVIVGNAVQGMELLVEHLYEQGHRSIGFLCGDISGSTSSVKTHAYKKALLKRNIEWDASKVVSSGWTRRCGYFGAKQLLGLHPDVTAIICISDELAIGTYSAIDELGYRCPEDISVAGFDGAPSSDLLIPKLTTVDKNGYDMGRIAADRIFQRMNHPNIEVDRIVQPMKLIVRDSTGKVRE